MATQDKLIPADQGKQILEDSIKGFDRYRAQGLVELTALEAAKYAVMKRDRPRLVAKFGEDHPRVAALDQGVALHRERLASYQAEILGASTNPPQVNDHSWAIHGHVLDAQLQPVEGVTVALYSGDAWERSLTSSCTDAHGHFQLGPTQIEKEKRNLSLKVSQKDKVIYTDPNPVIVAAGRLEYRRVILNERNQASCDPPPEATPIKARKPR